MKIYGRTRLVDLVLQKLIVILSRFCKLLRFRPNSPHHLAFLGHFNVTNLWFISTKKVRTLSREQAELTSYDAASLGGKFLSQQAGSPAPDWPTVSSRPHQESPSHRSPRHHTCSHCF